MSLIETQEHVILSKLSVLCIDEICRSCLTNKPEMRSLFASDSFTCASKCSVFDLKSFLNNYTGLQIVEGDGMPSMMCLDCIASLTAAYDFKKQCEKAASILNKFLVGTNKIDNLKRKKHKFLSDSSQIVFFETGRDKNKSTKCRRNNKFHYSQLTATKKIAERQIINSTIRNNGNLSDNSIGDVEDDVSLHNLSNIKNNGTHLKIKEEDEVFVGKEELLPDTEDIAGNITVITAKEMLQNEKCRQSSYQCSTCENSFTTARGLRLHNRVHGASGNLVCNACGRNFEDARSLRDHRLSHMGDKPFQCSYCDRKFAQKKPLQYHEKTHTGDRPHVCDVCGKSYIQPNNLVIHRRLHTGEKPFVCKDCGKAFTNGASLTLHMPVHTGVKNFVCTICGKRMARSGELTIHMRTHTGEKPYVCRTCSKAFIKKSSLQAHMYSHTGEKKFVCPICGHRVAHAGKLTVHIRTHSSAKPFACPICDRHFANQGYLKQHSKIHSGERAKPFVCIQCGRGFVKNRNLTEHMRTHTGERPYICLVCSHGFAQRSTLNFHMKSAHGEPKCLVSAKEMSVDRESAESAPRFVDKLKSVQHEHCKTPITEIMEQKKFVVKEEGTHSVSDSEDKLAARNEIPISLPSVIHPNPQDFATFKNTANNFIQSCDLKTVLDHRGAYDPRLLGFMHYPH